MTRKEAEARNQFESVVCEEAATLNHGALPQWSRTVNARNAANLIMRHGKTYARIQEAICNGVEWSQYDTNESFNKRQSRHEKWTEKREQQIERRIKELVSILGPGFGVVFSGDPRGATVKITLPSGKTNDWGREGYCVPTA